MNWSFSLVVIGCDVWRAFDRLLVSTVWEMLQDLGVLDELILAYLVELLEENSLVSFLFGQQGRRAKVYRVLEQSYTGRGFYIFGCGQLDLGSSSEELGGERRWVCSVYGWMFSV